MGKQDNAKDLLKITCVASADNSTVDMELNGVIDFYDDDYDGTGSTRYHSAQSFLDKFKELQGKHTLINIKLGACYGGSCFEGLAIYDAIASSTIPVNTHCIGLAASMGAIIYLAGHKRFMSPVGQLMIHAPSDMFWGNAAQARDFAEALQKMEDVLGGIITANSSKTAEDVSALMQKDSFLTLADAKEWGFVDEEITYTGRAVDATATATMSLPDAYAYYNRAINGRSGLDKIAQSFKAIFKPTAKAPIIHSLNPKNKMPLQYNAIVSAEVSMYVDSAGDAPVVGENAFTDEGLTTPAPDGDYMISGGDMDGQTIVITGGAISEIKPAEGATAPDASATPPTDATATALADMTAKFNAMSARMSALEKKGTTPHTVVPDGGDHQQASAQKEPLSYSQKMALEAAEEAKKPAKAWKV